MLDPMSQTQTTILGFTGNVRHATGHLNISPVEPPGTSSCHAWFRPQKRCSSVEDHPIQAPCPPSKLWWSKSFKFVIWPGEHHQFFLVIVPYFYCPMVPGSSYSTFGIIGLCVYYVYCTLIIIIRLLYNTDIYDIYIICICMCVIQNY